MKGFVLRPATPLAEARCEARDASGGGLVQKTQTLKLTIFILNFAQIDLAPFLGSFS
jgi:hypothetical protein